MGKYDDIINMPHPNSSKHPRMTLYNRAAQFSPFAALTGHEDAIKATARLTENKIELDEDEKMCLDIKLQMLRERKDETMPVSFTYYIPDEQKSGGKYVTHKGIVNSIDTYRHRIVMNDGIIIPMEDIIEIESSIFEI